jgi:hypothetical protein
MTTSSTIQPNQLPATIRAFLAAQTAGEVDAMIRTFAPTAEVVDEGHTFRGTDEVLGFLRKGGSEYTYTTELVGAERVDDEHWVAVNHLEGDFPGGVVDLRYRFTLADDLITHLTIAP